MKRFALLVIIAAFVTNYANATIRRVGFFGPPVSGVDYPSFTAAYAAAISGDTIYVFPGIANISGNMTKRLVIIGNGDYLDSASTPKGNGLMQANIGVATASSLTFSAGSDSSFLSGFSGGLYDIRTNNITICRTSNAVIYLTATASNYTGLQILDNFRVAITNYNVNGSNVSNMNISNNLIFSFYTALGNTYSGNISNNVWAYDNTLTPANNGGNLTMSNSATIELGGGAYLVQNNILASNTSLTANNNTNYFTFNNGGNSIFNYNMALQTSSNTNFGVGVGNVITPIANASLIFTGFPAIGTSSIDRRYQLPAGSPALTVGAGGKAIGLYAGNTPYRASLIPAIPSVYKLSSPQGNNPGGNTITINISTRGNN